MATHNPMPVEELEYVLRAAHGLYSAIANVFHSYEALSPDSTLTNNMLAGAFAGIAVGLDVACYCEDKLADNLKGAYRYVSCGPYEGEIPLSLPGKMLTGRRLGCR